MEPFTFSRSEQVCIDQGQPEMTTADFIPLNSSCRGYCVRQMSFILQHSLCFIKIISEKVHSTTALPNGSASSEITEYKIIIKIWFTSFQSTTPSMSRTRINNIPFLLAQSGQFLSFMIKNYNSVAILMVVEPCRATHSHPQLIKYGCLIRTTSH